MAEFIGPRMVIGVGLVLSGLLTALTPIAADISFWAIYTTRMVTGLLGVSVDSLIFLHGHLKYRIAFVGSFLSRFTQFGCELGTARRKR